MRIPVLLIVIGWMTVTSQTRALCPARRALAIPRISGTLWRHLSSAAAVSVSLFERLGHVRVVLFAAGHEQIPACHVRAGIAA